MCESPENTRIFWVGAKSDVPDNCSKHLLCCLHIPLVKDNQLTPLNTVHASGSIPPCHAAAKTQFLEGQIICSSTVNLGHDSSNPITVLGTTLTASKHKPQPLSVTPSSHTHTQYLRFQFIILAEEVPGSLFHFRLCVRHFQIPPLRQHL